MPVFSQAFMAISAGEISACGLPRGYAGATQLSPSPLTSLSGVFTVSPDTALCCFWQDPTAEEIYRLAAD